MGRERAGGNGWEADALLRRSLKSQPLRANYVKVAAVDRQERCRRWREQCPIGPVDNRGPAGATAGSCDDDVEKAHALCPYIETATKRVAFDSSGNGAVSVETER